MSSVNEQLAPPPKPRISPLEFRNTDLVSRLLAATPPYLYNMSLLPNTYFFSEMLRSFVQAKSDPSRNFPTRRTRKRPWTATKADSSSPPKLEQSSNDWMKSAYPEQKPESPLELTTDNDKISKTIYSSLSERKMDVPLQEPVEPLYSPMGQESNPSGLILPPPPPIWYPPLYPTATPYGIDPLHFFIDLRVSGHIYDKKNQREESSTKSEPEENKKLSAKEPIFKQSRHASAFSVPVPRASRCTPMNLSHSEEYGQESKNLKFDVKSMGFDKTSNKTGTSYIMGNINNIYKGVAETSEKDVKNEDLEIGTNENDNETEEEKQKRVKDLRALIGLELVVDYMNHAKPQPKRPEESFTDSESVGSPNVEVVAVHDET